MVLLGRGVEWRSLPLPIIRLLARKMLTRFSHCAALHEPRSIFAAQKDRSFIPATVPNKITTMNVVILFGAGAENRTPIPSLENLYTNRCTTPAYNASVYHFSGI